MTCWIVETLVASTLLMLGVLMLRGPVAGVFGPRAAYLLWVLPAVRMVLPRLPESVIATPISTLPHRMHFNAADFEALLAMPAIAPAPDPIAWGPILLAAWLGGAALHFGWHLFAYHRFVARTLGDARQLPLLDRNGVEVCASAHAAGPFATGIFHKTIVLPADYRRRYSRDELRLAMAHELEHHQRCDMSINLIALAALSLHWFNPIAHRAHRAFRVDQELACDAIVLADATSAERHAYGSALLKSACDRLPMAACALGAGDDLKWRLKMMAVNRPSRRQMRIGGVIATVLTGGGLLLTASGGIAAEASRKVEKSVRTAIRHDVAAIRRDAAAAAEDARRGVFEARHAVRIVRPPVPPAPPAPVSAAHPPAPPQPHLSVEFDQSIAEAVREAQGEALEARLEAAAEAREAHLEAAVEAREAQLEAAAEGRSAGIRVAIACAGTGEAMTAAVIDGSRRILRTGTCPGPSRAQIRATVIDALTEARAEVAGTRFEEAGRKGRAAALASIDRQLARLRAD